MNSVMMQRREYGLGLASAFPLLSGCSTNSDIHYPKERQGQPDLVLKNCFSKSKEVHITVTDDSTSEVVHNKTHSVPADFCSDIGPSYQIEDVWTNPGTYRIHAEVPNVGTAEKTVELTKGEVNEDTGTRYIRIDDGRVEIE